MSKTPVIFTDLLFILLMLYANDPCDLYWRGKGLSQEPQ